MGSDERRGTTGPEIRHRSDENRAQKRLRVRHGTVSPDHEAVTQNLSASGLYLTSDRLFAPGTTLNLEVFTDEGIFRLRALVTWTRQVPEALEERLHEGMGMQVIDPPEEWKMFCRRLGVG